MISVSELEDLKEDILSAGTAKEVREIVFEYLKERIGESLPYLNIEEIK